MKSSNRNAANTRTRGTPRQPDQRRNVPSQLPTARLASPDKPLDRMDRLADMAHFPALVNAGATANILLTIAVTYFLQSWLLGGALAPYAPANILVPAPLVWTALVLALNLTPVLVLRWLDRSRPARPMRSLRTMDFVRDQHRFSDWVYLAASANMAFWILLSWTVSFSTTPLPPFSPCCWSASSPPSLQFCSAPSATPRPTPLSATPKAGCTVHDHLIVMGPFP